jgi:hypothetical protein
LNYSRVVHIFFTTHAYDPAPHHPSKPREFPTSKCASGSSADAVAIALDISSSPIRVIFIKSKYCRFTIMLSVGAAKLAGGSPGMAELPALQSGRVCCFKNNPLGLTSHGNLLSSRMMSFDLHDARN